MNDWVAVSERLPKAVTDTADWRNLAAFCVLAVDAKNRMSVGYVMSNGRWVFAKPIGQVTHWMPLPDPPERR